VFTGSRVCPPDGASTWPSLDRGFSSATIPFIAAQLSKIAGQDRLVNFSFYSERSKTCVASRLGFALARLVRAAMSE